MSLYKLTNAKKAYTLGICFLFLFALFSCKKKQTVNSYEAIAKQKNFEKKYLKSIEYAFLNLDSILTTEDALQRLSYYKKARGHFKYCEPLLSFLDKNNFKTLNAPNIVNVQEEDLTDIKIINPTGFQVIEELLHETPIDNEALRATIKKTGSRLRLLRNNQSMNLRDYHIIWIVRNQLFRIATLGITGLDSPVLNQSLLESTLTYTALKDLMSDQIEEHTNTNATTEFLKNISDSQKALKNSSFEEFDRYHFIKNHINPQLKLLVKIQKEWGVKFPLNLAISNTAINIFGKKALNENFFSDYKSDTTHLKSKIELGKKLFNDPILSNNNLISCASCHQKEVAFTDQKVVFNSKQTRNTPTLTYAAYQQSFFMDARSGSLEGQIVGVIKNHDEFNISQQALTDKVIKNETYKNQLDNLYGNAKYEFNLRNAMAAYVRSLHGFSSKFDKNMRGEEISLTNSEINGFNLFMGKALCATCHFAPVFNGTVPPNFTETELEAIGVPKTKHNKKLDSDYGRYEIYKTEERKGFFKTPTIRNSTLTAPYMHNGVYDNLEEVVNFYVQGGGAGMGFDVPHQTLPFDTLELTDQDKKDLIAFMKSLTDEVIRI